MLTLILAESALEPIPLEIAKNNSVKKQMHRNNKSLEYFLLDKSIHFDAMKNLKDKHKRGRPDLIHITLLNIIATPLYKNDLVEIYVHTINNNILRIHKNVRLPKSYSRFELLISKLFREKIIEHENKKLIEILNTDLDGLVGKIKPDIIIGLSSKGEIKECKQIAKKLDEYDRPLLIIGGFPHGDFEQNTIEKFNEMYSMDKEQLESHIVCSRMLYEYELNCIENKYT
tara:strand:+ start:439 stop:1125 length:687 start_codon:yes stop_codon:yes gene_type:complete